MKPYKELAEPSVINSLIVMTTLFYKIPPHLPLPVFDRKKITKGREIIPLWSPAHRASGPEGKEGPGEIFRCMSIQF